MDGTWKDLIRLQAIKGSISPFDARMSIELGAIYQGKQRRAWGREGRTKKDRNDLGLCAYNRGLGNCLKDQRACGDARLWKDIEPCTAKQTSETVIYVRRINDYYIAMQRR